MALGHLIKKTAFKRNTLHRKHQSANPFNVLIKGIRGLIKGEYDIVEVPSYSPVSTLAQALNELTSHFQRKVENLESLSKIDREIAIKGQIDSVMTTIIERIQQLIPNSCVAVMRLTESDKIESHFHVNVSEHFELASNRITLATSEVNRLKSKPEGQFIDHTEANAWEFNTVFAECKSFFYWTYPVFWQGELRAIIAMKKPTAFVHDEFVWDKIRELSNRIGIAVRAQTREEALLVQAQYDRLTGLPNRILLQDRLKLAMEHSVYTGNSFWVALMDLDRFKSINDSLGHPAGDQILIEIASRLSGITQDTDTVSRHGGDGFVIIMQSEPNEGLRMEQLNRIIKTYEQPFKVNGNEIFVSASIGIAAYPNDGKTADEIISSADVAMYRAKEKGKNNIQFYTQSINKRVIDRLQMEMHLRKAIELNELELLYQPKVSLISHEVVGMEALISWNSDAFGVVPSQQFIPLAEETGLIVQIGEWALKTACAQTAKWRKQGFDQLLIAVNLSANQFKQPDLPNAIETVLQTTGLPAENLELELTESLVMNNGGRSLEILNRIKAIGVHLSIDDFGTGYSSLSYLNTLPVNTIKIDKSFIDNIKHRTDQEPIVASIINLAQNLDLKVVAEGVETLEQMIFLQDHRCNEMQGYYFSRSLNAHAFESLLKAGVNNRFH